MCCSWGCSCWYPSKTTLFPLGHRKQLTPECHGRELCDNSSDLSLLCIERNLDAPTRLRYKLQDEQLISAHIEAFLFWRQMRLHWILCLNRNPVLCLFAPLRHFLPWQIKASDYLHCIGRLVDRPIRQPPFSSNHWLNLVIQPKWDSSTPSSVNVTDFLWLSALKRCSVDPALEVPHNSGLIGSEALNHTAPSQGFNKVQQLQTQSWSLDRRPRHAWYPTCTRIRALPSPTCILMFGLLDFLIKAPNLEHCGKFYSPSLCEHFSGILTKANINRDGKVCGRIYLKRPVRRWMAFRNCAIPEGNSLSPNREHSFTAGKRGVKHKHTPFRSPGYVVSFTLLVFERLGRACEDSFSNLNMWQHLALVFSRSYRSILFYRFLDEMRMQWKATKWHSQNLESQMACRKPQSNAELFLVWWFFARQSRCLHSVR